MTRRVPAWRDDDAFECSHAAAAHTTAIFSRSFSTATGEISLDEFLVAVCADEVAVAPPAPPPTVASVIAALDEAVAPKAAAPPETAEVAAEAAPADEEEEAAESYFHRLSPPSGEGAAALVYYALTLPFALAFALTVPDCEHPAVLFGKRAHWVSFFMSILWIMLLCHYMVEGATAFGFTVGIPPLIMGQVDTCCGRAVRVLRRRGSRKKRRSCSRADRRSSPSDRRHSGSY